MQYTFDLQLSNIAVFQLLILVLKKCIIYSERQKKFGLHYDQSINIALHIRFLRSLRAGQ